MIASSAIDWMGGAGFVKSSPVEKFYRDSKIGIYPPNRILHLSC